ncbi:MAG: hypothetical protein ABSH28_01820 [Acidobacteriota bacterium]
MKVNLGTIDVTGEKRSAFYYHLVNNGIVKDGEKLTNDLIRNEVLAQINKFFGTAEETYLAAKAAGDTVTAAAGVEAAHTTEVAQTIELVNEVDPGLLTEISGPSVSTAAEQSVEEVPEEAPIEQSAPKKRGGRRAKAEPALT